MYVLTVEIPPASLDPEYHHLHHAGIILELEKTRLQFIADAGFPVEQFIAREMYLVVAGITIEYQREVTAGIYTSTIAAIEVRRKSLLIRQTLSSEKGKCCVEATFDIRILDGKLKRSVSIPSEFIEAMNKTLTRTESDG